MAVIGKNRQGYGYNYADLASVLNFVDAQMGLEVRNTTVYDPAYPSPYGCVLTSYRKKGENEWSEWLAPVPVIVGDHDANGKRKPSAMQMYGSAHTYARRYSIQAALGLATSDDDAQTSGWHVRDGGEDRDALLARVDEIMRELGVPGGQESRYVSERIGEPVVYGQMTNAQAIRFTEIYRKWKESGEQEKAA